MTPEFHRQSRTAERLAGVQNAILSDIRKIQHLHPYDDIPEEEITKLEMLRDGLLRMKEAWGKSRQ